MEPNSPPPDDLTIPPEIDGQFEGRWIAWDVADRKVLADGATLEEIIFAPAVNEAFAANRLIWYHHILPRDAIIVGGF